MPAGARGLGARPHSARTTGPGHKNRLKAKNRNIDIPAAGRARPRAQWRENKAAESAIRPLCAHKARARADPSPNAITRESPKAPGGKARNLGEKRGPQIRRKEKPAFRNGGPAE